MKTYQLNTVTYGTAAAPFLATRCLKQLAIDERSAFPGAAQILENDFYVDDCLTGSDNKKDVMQIKDELIQLTEKAGLKLTKWNSNHPELISALTEVEKNERVKIDPEKTTRTLGVCWNPRDDTLRYGVPESSEDEVITKRVILSRTARFMIL